MLCLFFYLVDDMEDFWLMLCKPNQDLRGLNSGLSLVVLNGMTLALHPNAIESLNYLREPSPHLHCTKRSAVRV